MTARPEIQTETADTIEEEFQNRTLRPILKMQNDLLILAFRQYMINQKINLKKLSISEQQEVIKVALKKDQHFRHFMRGLVAGHFTKPEWEIFFAHENELNKRIINLVEQRLTSQLADI